MTPGLRARRTRARRPAIVATLLAGPAVALVVLVTLQATLLADPAPAAPVGRPTATAVPTVDATVVASPQVARPRRVRIPAIGVDARLVPLGLRADGAMRTPRTGLAGWYRPGPRPGAPGPAVVVAHVDSTVGPDVFFRLADLEAGDRVAVVDAAGIRHRFAVTATERVAKDALPVERIWAPGATPALRLITCGGDFDHRTGHYRDNTIVYAEPA